jgi:glucose/arabinose dehydrogenase
MRTLLPKPVVAAILFITTSLSSTSIKSQPTLSYSSEISGLSFPVDIVNAGDGSDRLFIVEQGGLIKMYNGTAVSTFLNLTSLVPFSVANDERGLLSMAFHPDYDGINNRYFFVYYTTTSGNVTTIRVARYSTQPGNPNLADLTDLPDEVIAIAKPASQTNHNGGKLNFGADGMLYLSTGDGGGSNDPMNLSQNGNSLLGKILRIDINGTTMGFYSIPADNPFLIGGDGIRDEIWALGLRNPFRWSFDPVTNAMWIGDVGQSMREEVDVRFPSPTTGGVNYGWRCYEGDVQPPPGLPVCNPLPSNYVAPIFDYERNSATGGFCITGGVVYRGSAYPAMYGYYLFADYVSGNVWVMDQSGNVTQQTTDRSNVAAFGADEDGEIYVVSRGTSAGAGIVYNVIADFPLPVTLLSFTGKRVANYNELSWSTADEQNISKYTIQYSSDGSNFLTATEINAINNSAGSDYSYRHIINATKLFYRLVIRDMDGSSRYSSVIVIGNTIKQVKLYPTIVENHFLELNSNIPVENVGIYDQAGKQVHLMPLHGRQGYFSIQLPALASGVYFVKIVGNDFNKTEKIIVR